MSAGTIATSAEAGLLRPGDMHVHHPRLRHPIPPRHHPLVAALCWRTAAKATGLAAIRLSRRPMSVCKPWPRLIRPNTLSHGRRTARPWLLLFGKHHRISGTMPVGKQPLLYNVH
jgi:hypothetical protein